jgi:uncharacterized membrane protein
MKRITRYFFQGLLFLVPLVLTIYIIYIIFDKIDSLFGFNIPGLGFVLTLIIITAVGFITSNIIISKLVLLIDALFARVPLIKILYSAIKDLIDAFVGNKKSFDKPALVKLTPDSNVTILGFITCEDLNHVGLAHSVAVYLPQSYNFAGNLVIVPKSQVTPIKADSGNVMAFIVSGGVTSKLVCQQFDNGSVRL